MLSLCAGLVAMGLAANPSLPPPDQVLLIPIARGGTKGSSPAHQDKDHGADLTASSDVPGRFPEASTRALTDEDLAVLSSDDLRVMRNEILARHGYIFPSTDAQRYFAKQEWYKPKLRSVAGLLTDVERGNLDAIRTYEMAHGAAPALGPVGTAASGQGEPEPQAGIAIQQR